jgi:two-component system OmpR family sensor kinase
MMRSLTSRLVVATVALVAVVALAIGTATAIAMSSSLTGRLDHEVIGSLDRVQEHGPPPGGLPGGPGPIVDVRGQAVGTLTAIFDTGSSGQAVGDVLTDNGEGRTRSVALSSDALAALAAVPADRDVHEVHLPGFRDYRVAAIDLGDATLVSGLPSSQVDDVVNSLIWWEILLSLLGIAAAAGAALLVVRRQLAPLRGVAATAHEVAALPLSSGEVDLSARVADPDERTEVGQVGAALNTLLAHVESSLEVRHRSEQQVRQFVADASHELRTPLSTIRGYAELATRTPDDPAALGGSLAKVSAEADRMSALVEDLLLLARLDAGRPLDREPVDLTHLLLEAVADARVLGPEHHWRLDLPDEPVEVPGDEQRLHQVVTNLVANAIRHTPPGTTVTLSATPSGDGVDLVVADDGPGFPDGDVGRAFERFTRGDAARTRTDASGLGGVGLGLSIVKAIVEAHEGSVSLASRPGHTRVTVTLPGTGTRK